MSKALRIKKRERDLFLKGFFWGAFVEGWLFYFIVFVF
jgi:hypothetical protein